MFFGIHLSAALALFSYDEHFANIPGLILHKVL